MFPRSNAVSLRRLLDRSFSRPAQLLAASVVFLVALPLTSSAQPSFAEFPVPSGTSSNPQGICTGPDGAVWFVESSINAGNAKIGRITVNGAFTEYTLPSGSEPQQIVTGPDGNLYFTVGSGGHNFIGQLIPSTGVIAEFNIPQAGASPTGLTVGPGPSNTSVIWFAEAAPGANAISYVTTTGTFKPTPIAIPTSGAVPTWLTLGPDNNIWFTEQATGKIGVVKNGTTIMDFAVNGGSSAPFAIASDGTNLWFTDRSANSDIWEITNLGSTPPTFTSHATLTLNAAPFGITKGPDGAMWFTETAMGANKIGRITTGATPTVSEYSIPTANAGAYAITAGPDGALWFTEDVPGAIGRISELSFESFGLVPGALTQVSIGADGSIWGINSSQQIFTYNVSSSSWTNIPGALRVIASGNANAVWGLNAQNHIYQLKTTGSGNSLSYSWNQIPGELNSIAVGADGDVWGLNVNNSIYHYIPSLNGFGEVGGTGATLSSISVGSAGAVYGVNYAGSIYWYNPGKDEFEYLTGTIGFDTSPGSLGVGIDGDVWALKGGVAYHWDVLHNEFVQAAGASGVTQLAVGSGAAVFALGTGASVFQWDATSQTFVQLTGALVDISAGANGTVWGVNASNQIYRLLGAPERAYQTLNVIPGAILDQISVGADGTVWGVVNFTVQYFNRGTQTFQTVPTPSGAYIAQVSVGAGNDVWGVTGCHNPNPTTGACPNPAEPGVIYEYIAGATPTWKQIAGELNLVQVGANGDVWGINAAGETYYYDGTGWVQIPGQLGILSVGADGTVWGINANFQIYRYSGGPSGTWDNIPGSLTGISVGNANNVWGININDQIYTWSNHFTAAIPGQLDEVWTTFDGAVWGSNSGNSAYQWNGSSFVFMGNGISDVLLGNAVNVWGTNSGTGAVYQWF